MMVRMLGIDAAAGRVLAWLDSGLEAFDPFGAAESDRPAHSAPVEKIWAECAMLYWICLGLGYGADSTRRTALKLAEPVKSPYFLHRASRERARFGACIHNLALARDMGMDVAEEAQYIERLIREGGFWSPDLEGWETAEVAFSRALLGAGVAHSDVRSGLKRSILFQPDRNVCFIDRTEAYKLTHAVFYDTGFAIEGLYQGVAADGVQPPPGAGEALDALCGRFLLRGQFDLALELVLSAALYGLELTGVQLQTLVLAMCCVGRLGYVPPLVFDAARPAGENESVDAGQHEFRRNYHASLVFVLIAALLRKRGRTEALNDALSAACCVSDSPVMAVLPDLSAPRIAAANGGLAVGEMLNAAERYDLQKAALLLPALRRAGQVAPGGRVERSVQSFLRLQQRPDGGYGWFGVEEMQDENRFKSLREMVNQAVASAL